ncbi:hypothetical protein SAMN05444266_105191 [Chitinophaga jiangningensis]|uniref:Uncharacterized protein n=1 Tax=Chitinophaga jiangningensis TaxID=1419482 RepID=A0A1M7DY63_9BACT|nr:hypothetical protein [Chitinophaga jiangningensis]SHL84396.1 hypothetical protein SAMN05444266_105191 [Chitinophaga jiangningensis]
MKNSVTLILMLLTVCIFSSCRKNDNPKLPDNIREGVLPLFTQTAGSANLNNISTFTATFDLDYYFRNALKATKVDIYAAYDGDYEHTHLIQANVTLPAKNITVTGAQLIEWFGINPAQLVKGEFIEIGADMTLPDGTLVKAFPFYIDSDGNMQAIAPYSSNSYGMAGSNPSLYWEKKN